MYLLKKLKLDGWSRLTRCLFILTLCSLSTAIGYIIYLQKPFAQLQNLEHQQNQLKQNYQNKYQQFINWQQLKKQREKIDMRFGKRLNNSMKPLNLPTLLNDLARIAQTQGLKIQSIKPTTQQNKDTVSCQTITLHLSGNYSQFIHFLALQQYEPWLAQVKELQIKSKNTKENALTILLGLEVCHH